MVKNLYKFLDEMLAERVDEIINYTATSNKAFKELSHEVSDVYTLIRSNLPEKSKNDLDKFQDAFQRREVITYESVYHQGIKDGIRLGILFSKLHNKDIRVLKRLLKK